MSAWPNNCDDSKQTQSLRNLLLTSEIDNIIVMKISCNLFIIKFIIHMCNMFIIYLQPNPRRRSTLIAQWENLIAAKKESIENNEGDNYF